MNPPVVLGERYRDNVTGYEGIVTARHEFLHGCVRYTIERGNDGKVEMETFDEQRLVAVATEQAPAATARRGGDHAAPSSRPTGAR